MFGKLNRTIFSLCFLLPLFLSAIGVAAKSDSASKVSAVSASINDPNNIVSSSSDHKKEAVYASSLKLPKIPSGVSSVLIKAILLLCSISMILYTILFFKEHGDKNRFMTTTRLSIMDKEVQRACKYIELNFENPDLSIDNICTALVTGKAFLNAIFERELGITVEAFIEQVRINRAKILLNKKPDITVDELATGSGFKETDSFLQTFRNISGIQFDIFQKSLSNKVQS